MFHFLENAVAIIATILGTFLMLPQVIKINVTKKAGDVSVAMAFVYWVNCLFWIFHGLFIHSWAVFFTNVSGIIIATFQLILIRKYSEKNNRGVPYSNS